MKSRDATSGITPRSIVLGLVLVLGISFAVSHAELVTARILIGSKPLPPVVIAAFALALAHGPQSLYNGWVTLKHRRGVNAF